MLHEDTFKVVDFSGVKGLVYIGDRILTIRRDHKTKNSPGCMDLPGGGREGDETPFDTFKRETMEELGITIIKEDLIASFRQNSSVNPGTKSFFLVARPKGVTAEDVVFGNEGTEWVLMSVEEFLSRNDGIPRQQDRVSKYINGRMISE